MRAAIQGIRGSFHDLAAQRYFAGAGPLELVECDSFADVFESVASGKADRGVAAIENTIAGSIPGNYGLLQSTSLSIVGEMYLRIRHCLLALPGTSVKEIERLLAHPVAIPQCSRFLAKHPWMRVEEAPDTASAAKRIADEGLERTAAIAGYKAAELYGLEVLGEGIEDEAHNATRFLVLARQPNALSAACGKASLSMRLTNRPGALAEALAALKFADLNLTKIESVPLMQVPFEYAIHLDVTFDDPRDFSNAMRELERRSLEVRVLGVYAPGEKDLDSTAKTPVRKRRQPEARPAQRVQEEIGCDWREWGLPPSAKRPDYLLIAGPCSAETEEQLVSTAVRLKASGWPCVLRAGIWKPRTRAGGFEGHGAPALAWLQEAKRETGLATAVEVASASHVEAALEHGVDVLWVGARTTGNPFSVQEIADALRGTDVAVLVKNPVSPDLELWVGALERLASAGLRRLGAIHRGFSFHAGVGLRNPPEWNVALQFRERLPSVPMICDPSHIAGRRDAIPSLAQRAIDLGMAGLMVEVHPRPDEAWTDARQQLSPAQYGELMEGMTWRPTDHREEQLSGRDWDKLETLRSAIDRIDHEMLELLSARMDVVRQIGDYKRAHSLEVLQPERWAALMDRRLALGGKLALSPGFVEEMFRHIHDESVRLQSTSRARRESA